MSVVIDSRPQVVLNPSSTPPLISKWVAAWHPVIWQFQRRDFDLVGCEEYTGSGGGWQLTVSGDQTAEIVVGDTIYIYNATNINSNAVVTDCYYSAPNTIIVVDYTADTDPAFTDGFINLVEKRTGYFVEMEIYDDSFVTKMFDDPAIFRDNATGLIKGDIQTWLQTRINQLRTSLYQDYGSTVINDDFLGSAYGLKIREYWNEAGYGAWDWVRDEANDPEINYYVNAVKYIGDQYGQNMALFVPLASSTIGEWSTGGKNLGKFLTMFESPTFFQGYPFDLSFIWDPSLPDNGITTKIVEVDADINTDVLASLTTTFVDYSGHVCRVIPTMAWTAGVYVRSFTLRATKGITNTAISESLMVYYNDGCVNNAEFFRWLNPRGGFDYWLFVKAQDYAHETGDEQVFEPFIENLADANARAITLTKDAQLTIKIGAENLSAQQINGLIWMTSSIMVQRHMGLDENNDHKWQTCRVKPGSFQYYKTDENKFSIEMVIVPPQYFNQSN